MAYRTVTEFVDDLDGGEAHETVTFGLDGVHYRIDLSEANATRLRQELALFIRHGRRAESTRRSPSATGASAGEAARNRQIRSWAQAAGLPINYRGRIPAEITAMFRARHD
ncbi:Lsr2 protein [Umezawaea tangerina]|uniref:Lsr2 protein n=2 Tax=Umezawaea tangerina TaxID=84725 RepID=A0A2T0SZZ8_9PSEU|nr:Lsr2 family protein [Umezawaea tangerina]PRY38933.1 Lsr2 protein [Umezawaea tangerina]